MTSFPEKPKRGGARPGAGRHRVDSVERRVRVSRELDAALVALGDGRFTKGIQILAESHAQLASERADLMELVTELADQLDVKAPGDKASQAARVILKALR